MSADLHGTEQLGLDPPWVDLPSPGCRRDRPPGAFVADASSSDPMTAAHSRLRFIRTLTRGPGPDPRGRILGLLPDLCGDLTGHQVFIAGSSGFVLDCAAAAAAAGATRVQTEVFFVEPT